MESFGSSVNPSSLMIPSCELGTMLSRPDSLLLLPLVLRPKIVGSLGDLSNLVWKVSAASMLLVLWNVGLCVTPTGLTRESELVFKLGLRLTVIIDSLSLLSCRRWLGFIGVNAGRESLLFLRSGIGRSVLLALDKRSCAERLDPRRGRGQAGPGELRAEGSSGEGEPPRKGVDFRSGEGISVVPPCVAQSSCAEGSGEAISARRHEG